MRVRLKSVFKLQAKLSLGMQGARLMWSTVQQGQQNIGEMFPE